MINHFFLNEYNLFKIICCVQLNDSRTPLSSLILMLYNHDIINFKKWNRSVCSQIFTESNIMFTEI